MSTLTVNDLMDELEQETKIIMVNGEPKTVKEVLDSILCDEKKQRRFSEG
jgi:hypothetical protein